MTRKRPVLPSGGGWELTGHVCRFCLARVLRRGEEYVCSTCAVTTHDEPIGICGCGMHLGPMPKNLREADRRRLRTPKGFHCSPNPTVTDNSPALNVIFYLDAPVSADACEAA